MSDSRLFKTQRFECQCSSFDHSVRFSTDDEGTVYLDVGLNPSAPWWRRVALALRYVFSPGSSRYGTYDEVILREGDRTRMIEFLGGSRDESR